MTSGVRRYPDRRLAESAASAGIALATTTSAHFGFFFTEEPASTATPRS